MAKLNKKIFAAIVALPILFLSFATPAFASTVPAKTVPASTEGALESWDTVIKPNSDGSMHITSTLESINASESVDLALPVKPDFAAVGNYEASSGNYTYSNPVVSAGYTVSTIKNKTWNIFSVKSDGSGSTEPIVLDYTVSGAVLNTGETQQLNLPLIDSSHNDKINTYSVSFDTSNAEYLPAAACVSKPSVATECNTLTDNTWSATREQSERISLRAKFSANTFALPPIVPVSDEETETVEASVVKNVILPEAYLRNFTSWDYEIDAFSSSDTTSVRNTITYDKSEENSNVIAIAYPAYQISEGGVGYTQTYYNPHLSGDSKDLYDLTLTSDVKDKNDLALFVITPKPDAIIPDNATVTYNYTVRGAIMGNSSWDDKNQTLGFVAKHKVPSSVVDEVSVKVSEYTPLPVAADSSCDTTNITCEISEDGLSYLVKGKIQEGFINYAYEDGAFNVSETNLFEEEGFDFTGILIGFLLTALLIAYVFVIFATSSAAKKFFNSRKNKTVYEIAPDKSLLFLPSADDTNVKIKKLRTDSFPELSNISYSPPTTDDGKEISSYLYLLLSGVNLSSESQTNKITLAVLTSLVAKGEIIFETDKMDIFINVLQTSTFNERSLSSVEEAVLKTLRKDYPKTNLRINVKLLQELFKVAIENNLKSELADLALQQEKRKNKRTAVLAKLLGVTLLVSSALVIFNNFNPLGAIIAIVLAAIAMPTIRYGSYMFNVETMSTLTGTGYYSRITAFGNYFNLARSESRYSLEKADKDGLYLPWAITFGQLSKWVEVFSVRSTINPNKIMLGKNEVDTDTIIGRLDYILHGEYQESAYSEKQEAAISRIRSIIASPFSNKLP